MRNAHVVIAVTCVHARNEGVAFYKSPNNAVLSDGVNGVIPPRYFRSVFLVHHMKLLLPIVDGVWRIGEPAQEGNPSEDSDYGDDIPTEPKNMAARGDQSLFESDEEACAGSGEVSLESDGAHKNRQTQCPKRLEMIRIIRRKKLRGQVANRFRAQERKLDRKMNPHLIGRSWWY